MTNCIEKQYTLRFRVGTRKKGCLEVPGVGGNVILKRIFKAYSEKAWRVLLWATSCECGNEDSGSVIWRNFSSLQRTVRFSRRDSSTRTLLCLKSLFL